MYWGVGQTESAPVQAPIPAVTLAPYVCPPCSYLTDGHCVWCPESAAGDGIPECFDCDGRILRGRPWYASAEFWVPVATMIVGSVVSAIIVSRLRFGKRR